MIKHQKKINNWKKIIIGVACSIVALGGLFSLPQEEPVFGYAPCSFGVFRKISVFLSVFYSTCRTTSSGLFPLSTVILYSISGQSNSVASNGAPALSLVQPYSNQMWTNTTSLPLVEPIAGSTAAANTESLASGSANQLSYLRGTQQVSWVDNWGEGGQPCSVFLKSGGTRYANAQTELGMMKDHLASTSPGTAFFPGPLIWVQGEQDEGLGVTSSAYAINCLGQLQSDWQADSNTLLGTSTTIPLITIQNMNWTRTVGGNQDIGTVSIGHWIAARDNANVALSHSAYHIPTNAADLHYTNVGHRLNGEYVGKALRAWAEGSKWVPMSPASVTCATNTITLTVQGGDSGGVVFDTSTVVLKPNYGFEYGETSPQADLPVVTNVTTDSSSTITITLNRNCESDGRLRYAYSAIPSTSAGPTSNGGAGGNVRRSTSTIMAQHDGTTALTDWLVSFDEPIGTCTGCTASATSTFANVGSYMSDNSPLGWLSCLKQQSTYDGQTTSSWSFWVRRNNATWATADTGLLSRNFNNERQFNVQARLSGTMRILISSTTDDTATRWDSASSTFTGNTWYLVSIVFDGRGATNADRLKIYQNATEITASGTFNGVVSSSLTSGIDSDFAIGGVSGGTGGGQEMFFAHVAQWTGYALTSSDITALYNSGTPIDARTLAVQPTHYYPLQTNGEDLGTGTSTPCRAFGPGGAYTVTHP